MAAVLEAALEDDDDDVRADVVVVVVIAGVDIELAVVVVLDELLVTEVLVAVVTRVLLEVVAVDVLLLDVEVYPTVALPLAVMTELDCAALELAPAMSAGPGTVYEGCGVVYRLYRMPGSVFLYSSVPSTPAGTLVPVPLTISRLKHCGYAWAPLTWFALCSAMISCRRT